MEVLGYLIPIAIFAALFFAIRHFWLKGKLTDWTRNRLYFVLGAVALIWFLSAIGMFGETIAGVVRDPLLNR